MKIDDVASGSAKLLAIEHQTQVILTNFRTYISYHLVAAGGGKVVIHISLMLLIKDNILLYVTWHHLTHP